MGNALKAQICDNAATMHGLPNIRKAAGVWTIPLTMIMAILLTAMMASCSKADIEFQGEWYRSVEGLDVYLSFEQETFWLRVGSGSRQMAGRFEIKENILKVVDEDCGEAEGIYRLARKEGRLSFAIIEDICEGRASVLQGEWVEKE